MPAGSKIKALHIYQIFPQSMRFMYLKHNTGLQVPGLNSTIVARAVLRTVPVEKDGSAFFIVPAKKKLFFQAPDENGMAVQTMRSGTHFMPGENTKELNYLPAQRVFDGICTCKL